MRDNKSNYEIGAEYYGWAPGLEEAIQKKQAAPPSGGPSDTPREDA